MSLNRFELDDVSDFKIINKLVLKLLVSLRVSQEYSVLQLSYSTTRYFNPVSQVAIQFMLSDWVHVHGRSVVQRKQYQYNVKKKHQEPQSCQPRVLIWSHWLETYPEPFETSKMECFAKIVNEFYTLTVFTKRSILDIWQGSEYASDFL